MDYYFDEQLPKLVANALNLLESHEGINRVFSTEESFGKGIKDTDLFRRLKEVNGILVTHDLKMTTRKNELSLIKELGISAFVISLPSGSNFELQYQTIIGMWPSIKKISRKNRNDSFVCRIKMRGEPEFL
jgi:hypothetical protein